MSARKHSDVVKGRPGEVSSSSDMNNWMRTFKQENEDEALKTVLDMSKVRSFKQLHCILHLQFSKCNASPVGLKCLLLLRTCLRRCCVRIESFVSAKMQKVVPWK